MSSRNIDFVLGLERTGKINSRKYDEFHQDQSDTIAFYRVRETIEYEAKNRVNLDINSKCHFLTNVFY